MLRELRLENYAVIDNVVVEFAPGLNLLTGETGAGKSILIDALALLLGEKASTDVIRHHAERAVVAAVFEAEGKAGKALGQILEANGLDQGDGELILRREIAAAGKGRVFINNQPATVAVLRQLASHLAAIHAQSESLVSFDAAARLELLDAFAGAQVEPVEIAFREWKAVRERIAELERDEQDRLRLLDLWSFQQKEINAARPQAGEDDRLESEKRVLANAEKIYAAAMGAYDVLYESNASASSALRAAQRQIEELARFEPSFQELVAALDSARITAEDAGATLRDYAGGVQASPQRLAEVEDRLATLDRLKRKYGPTLADVIAFAEELSRKLADMQNKDEVLGHLRKELAAAGQQYLAAARALSRKRQESARKLEKLVEHEVNELAMKVRFRIQVAGSGEDAGWTAAGFDEVAYLIATNPGEPEKPLEEVASGGELSRVMLALKACVEAGQGPQNRRNGVTGQRTLVFDEIDTGIGGRAAEAVGRKLKQLAGSSQVLCVTHLPQIACFADHHYLIQKSIAGGRTRTTVRRIQGSERTDEVARMLSGARLTEASRRNAEQMLRAHA
ncbi:MAG TPA: DNA repair protein RecN [Terriglobales bacterium]|nr:DNA repair protein RecN [Terriglobales bacterium]